MLCVASQGLEKLVKNTQIESIRVTIQLTMGAHAFCLAFTSRYCLFATGILENQVSSSIAQQSNRSKIIVEDLEEPLSRGQGGGCCG